MFPRRRLLLGVLAIVLASCSGARTAGEWHPAPLARPAEWPSAPALPRRTVVVTVEAQPEARAWKWGVEDFMPRLVKVPVSGLCRRLGYDHYEVEIAAEERADPRWLRHILAHELWHALTTNEEPHASDPDCLSFTYCHLLSPQVWPCPEELAAAKRRAAGYVYRVCAPQRDAALRVALEWSASVWNRAFGRLVVEIDP